MTKQKLKKKHAREKARIKKRNQTINNPRSEKVKIVVKKK